MLKYIALLPHSPIVLNQNQSSDVDQAFQTIAKDLTKLKISNIISFASHPLYERKNFSVYANTHYTLQFKEFGDLVTRQQIPLWWQAYYFFRENYNIQAIDVIDEQNIDYAHAIPLFKLNGYLEKKYHTNFIALNNNINADNNQKSHFGKYISKIDTDSNYAVIVNSDLYSTTDTVQSDTVHQKNNNIRVSVSENNLNQTKTNSLAPTILPPCLLEMLPILKAMLTKKFNYTELLYKNTPYTSLLVSKFFNSNKL